MRGKVFDLRLPLGCLFLVLGGLLLVKGLMDDPAVYARSLGINLNLIWGGGLVLFGAVCLFLAMRHGRREQ